LSKVCRKLKDAREVDSGISAATAAGNDYSCDDTESLSKAGVVQQVDDDTERSGEMCVGPGKRDIVIFTRRMFTQLCT